MNREFCEISFSFIDKIWSVYESYSAYERSYKDIECKILLDCNNSHKNIIEH